MFFFFFFNDTATTEIYTLSLHDALPIYDLRIRKLATVCYLIDSLAMRVGDEKEEDRKSTRLNSSHGYISYAVFCLKKKKMQTSSSGLHTHNSSRCSKPLHLTPQPRLRGN